MLALARKNYYHYDLLTFFSVVSKVLLKVLDEIFNVRVFKRILKNVEKKRQNVKNVFYIYN